MYYKDDGDACEDDTGGVRGGGWRGRSVGRMDSVDCGGRRIGLGRCKKDGEV